MGSCASPRGAGGCPVGPAGWEGALVASPRVEWGYCPRPAVLGVIVPTPTLAGL